MSPKKFSFKNLNSLLKISNQKWPSFGQWRQVFRVFTKREKISFLGFFILAFCSFIFLFSNYYFKNTEIAPAQGGIYIEGVIGQPRFINPIYATSNDVDRDLVELLFSGLMKYGRNGEIIPDISQNYSIEEGGKVYKFYLKENVFWSDGKKLSAEDVIFTIKTIQNPDCKSPFRTNWLDIEVEKISETTIKFRLEKPYSGFLELLTLKILPAHIWQNIPPENIALNTFYNLQPVSCGPYKLEKINLEEVDEGKKSSIVKSLTLKTDPHYFGKKPYISKIIFYFFNEEKEIIKAAQQGKIKGFSLTSFENNNLFQNYFSEHKFILPRYFAVFFNPEKSKVLTDKSVRQALNYATDKKEIIEKALLDQGKQVESPILPEIYGFELPLEIYEYDLEKSKAILEKVGFKENEQGLREKIIEKQLAFKFKSRLEIGSKGKEVEELQKCLANPPAGGQEIYPEGEISGYFGQKTKEAVIRFQEKYQEEILKPWGYEKGTGVVGKTTREKLNEVCFGEPKEILSLKFSLITVEDTVLKKVAYLLKEQWQKIGVELEVQSYPGSLSQFQYEFIKPRNYDSLLFGEVLGIIPDPYPFWHSLQKRDPGLNLAIYENKTVDNLLEEARQSQDIAFRKEKLEKFQKLLIDDAPCVFLYSPSYIYLISNEIKGIETGIIAEPSKRFSEVENWYIKTHRVFR